ncbi:E3 ubiquitin-protein ligase RNF138-like isoform X2 [Ictalurus furcatus]|uniref:E3 ubiquitin-protein ligase RNF138-like isoform X2 n=1 Tax=Ictalurus furcatus TaxID=66913 RepID=UPI00234FC6A4|nr:E3 ubiquitin-protein ligase RNF138-like isoform X2 [Ictalurus furcatus]
MGWILQNRNDGSETELMGNSSGLSMESSEASPTADVGSDAEADYDCPICQEVLKMPIRTKNCQHVFCRSCFQTAVRSQGPQCPLCRSPVSEREHRATDIQQKMREKKGKCRACGKEKFLSKMRLHYRTCRKYIDEFGPIDEPTVPLPVQTPTQPQSSVFIPNIVIPTHSNSAGRVYACPYCSLMDLSDMALVEHCVRQHHQDQTPIVCPICASMPWGIPDYISRNFIGHLVRRHRFSYTTYMNESEDDDVQLFWALQVSVQEF